MECEGLYGSAIASIQQRERRRPSASDPSAPPTSVRMASGPCCRASSWMSATTRGRPEGFPDTPFTQFGLPGLPFATGLIPYVSKSRAAALSARLTYAIGRA